MYFGEQVVLRALEMDDLEKILAHWNTYEIRRFLVSQLPHSRASEKEWLERAMKFNPWTDGNLVFAVDRKDSGEFLGNVGLHRIDPKNSRAEFGIALHNPANLGKGLGSDATKVLLWVGFHILGLRTIYLHVNEDNRRAIKSYEKNGFRHAGRFRNAVFLEGKSQDLLAMDILQEEFFKIYPPGTFVSPDQRHEK